MGLAGRSDFVINPKHPHTGEKKDKTTRNTVLAAAVGGAPGLAIQAAIRARRRRKRHDAADRIARVKAQSNHVTARDQKALTKRKFRPKASLIGWGVTAGSIAAAPFIAKREKRKKRELVEKESKLSEGVLERAGQSEFVYGALAGRLLKKKGGKLLRKAKRGGNEALRKAGLKDKPGSGIMESDIYPKGTSPGVGYRVRTTTSRKAMRQNNMLARRANRVITRQQQVAGAAAGAGAVGVGAAAVAARRRRKKNENR
jgi:hypothetical protein